MTDKKVVNKQPIRSVLVNTSLQKLQKINPFYSNITTHNELEGLNEQSDLVLWKLLTDKNAGESNNRDQTDSDGDIEGNGKFTEGELNESSSAFPTVMYNVDGPNISPSEVINIAPGEGQIPVDFSSDSNWEALAFPKDYATGRNHFNEEEKNPNNTLKIRTCQTEVL